MTPSPPVRRFNWSNLGVRVLSAAILAPLALYAAFAGGWPLLAVIIVAVGLTAVEWGRMTAPSAPIATRAPRLCASRLVSSPAPRSASSRPIRIGTE